MNKLLFIIVGLSIISSSLAQEKKEETKYDKFSSKTGKIIKYIDYHLPKMNNKYATVETRIRKLLSGNESTYFYQIEKSDSRAGDKTASIAYDDLLELLKALDVLKKESSKDLSSKPDYLENKFITTDGFQLGYFVQKDEIQWYIVLEKYGSGNTIFVDNIESIDKSLTNAKTEIDKLKNIKS
jgi:hypothetical protein